jgi:hypothetical protein
MVRIIRFCAFFVISAKRRWIGFDPGRFARADSRPCLSYRPSRPARYFLLLVQEKVTKENTPSVSRPSLREGFATGGRGFADEASCLAAKGARSLARPRVRGTRALSVRPSPRHRGSRSQKLLRQGLPRFALALPGPSRPRRAGAGKSRKAVARRMRASSLSVHGRTVSEPPEPARAVTRARMRA